MTPTTVVVPAAYTSRGVRDNRASPMMMRMSGLVTLPKGPQKMLIRFGPDNQRAVQTALRNIALALGIPPDHLP